MMLDIQDKADTFSITSITPVPVLSAMGSAMIFELMEGIGMILAENVGHIINCFSFQRRQTKWMKKKGVSLLAGS